MRRLLSFGLCLALPLSALARPAQPVAEVVTGLGVGSYNQDLGRATDTGFAWTGRFGLQPFAAFGGELSYQGLTSDFSDVTLPNGFNVAGLNTIQQAFSLNARAGLPIRLADSQLYLYGLVGAGYSYIYFTQGGFFVGDDSDNAFMVPFGGGISFIFPRGFLIDGRFTYNLLTGDRTGLVRSGDSWIVGINIGTRFRT